MRVVCPACAAVYEVPASVVEARRTLRCTSCQAQFPAGEAKPPGGPTLSNQPARESVSPSLPSPDTAELRVDGRARISVSGEMPPTAARPRAAAIVASWALSLVLLAAGAGAVLAWRQPIMRAWPPSARAYAALGYPH